MAFSSDEVERYARHLLLKEIGGPGQQKLKAARVLVAGLGGLGGPAVSYLAAAGVGTLGLADDDNVALSNLQRQVLFGTADIGQPKVDCAMAAAGWLNPDVKVEPHMLRLTAKNAESVIAKYDLVLDATDTFESRYALSDAAFRARKPLIMGWLGPWDGGITTLRPYEKAPDGTPSPTYRCLFPEAPAPGAAPSCAETGVIGPLAGMVGTMMALEALREIVGFGEGLTGTLLHIDALMLRFTRVAYAWDRENALTGAVRAAGAA